MKEIKDLTLQEVQELLQKEMNRFKGIITFLEDCKKYDIMRIEDGIEPVTFAPDIYADSNDGWIPVNPDGECLFPKNDDYALVSFSNLDVPSIGRYEVDEEGGAFYPGDEDKSYASLGVVVNAWQPLPKPYREVEEEHEESWKTKDKDVETIDIFQAIERLEKYEALEKQGLLIKLPCKVGDTLWATTKNFVSEKIPLRTFPCIVREIRIKHCNCVYLVLRADINDITYSIWWSDIKVTVDKIGKIIFLTEQEAEESLRKE